MPEYSAHVLVCTNSEGAEDRRHCGDKAGKEIRKRFNELLVSHGLADRVTVNNVGCTSQHALCSPGQGSVTVYGPRAESGGAWYVATPDDVEEIITEHLENGRLVQRLYNDQRSVKLA